MTVGWYLAGSTAGGAGAGWLMGWLGWATGRATGLAGQTTLWTLAALTLVGVILDARLFGTRLPSVRRQVNEDWLQRYRGWVYGLGFGVQLGLGAVTIVSISAVYLALAAAFLSGSPAAGTTIGLAFGLIRASTVLGGAAVR